MTLDEIDIRVKEMRAALAAPHADPKSMQDDLQRIIDQLEQHHEAVPADLREAVEELQAEILEEFYDNLPV